MQRTFTIFLSIIICTALLSCGKGDANSRTTDSAPDSTQVQKEKKEGRRFAEKDRRGKWGKSEDEQNSAVPVEVTDLSVGSISSYLLYSSTLETEQTVDVYSRIGGLVEQIFVEESQYVTKGQKLVQIEKDEYELAEQKALIEYQKQKANYDRFKALQAEELLSEEEFENARLAMKQAEIAWKQAALNLEYSTVTSPISGVVGDRLVRLGDRIQPSSKLFTISNLNEKIVPVYVPQDEFSRCYQQQKAIITCAVVPGVKLDGYVKRISPIIDPQSGTFKVTVAVKDPENRLRPGMFVSAQLIVDTHHQTHLIPKSALMYENERSYFFVVKGDSSIKVELQRGFEDAEKVEVLNELMAGSKIVVLGQSGLKNGSKVRITEEKEYTWQKNPATSDNRPTSDARTESRRGVHGAHRSS